MGSRDQTIEGFHLSRQQARVWQQHNASLRCDCLALIEGPLNEARLERSVRDASARHEILRAQFRQLPGLRYPLQVVSDGDGMLERMLVPDELARAGGTASDLGEGLCELARALTFDHANGPAMRWALCPLPDSRHVLFLSAPALCADARSLRLLVEAIAADYAGDAAPGAGPQSTVQYPQFAEWQRMFLADAESEAAREYWCSPECWHYAPLRLPTERPGDPNLPFAPRFVRLHLPTDLRAEVHAVSARLDVAPATFLQACWQSLLWRLSDQAEIVVGTLADGRTHEELDDAVGPYATHLPIGHRFERGTGFIDLLKQLESSIEEAGQWQHAALVEHDAEASSGADASRRPAVTFDYTTWSQNERAGGLTISLLGTCCVTDDAKLQLSFEDDGHEFRGTLAYDTRRFDADAADAILACLERCMRSALDEPERRVAELDIVPGDQIEKLIVTYNATAFDYPAHRCLHELVEEQVDRAPDRIAAVFGDQKLTYTELESRSNQLARYLQALGIGPESLVAISLERSLAMLIAVLGVLKAGGAFVPMAPDYSKIRAAYILDDSRASLLLSDTPSAQLLPEHSVRVVRLDADWAEVAHCSEERPESRVAPDNLAYIVYTSGLTGKPKGVEVEHRSIVNYLCWVNEVLIDERLECLPFATRLTFDAALKQLFVPLLRGAMVHVMSDAQARDPEALLSVVASRRHTGLNCVPSLWASMLTLIESEHGPQAPTNLQWLYLGGEQISPELLERSWRIMPGLRIWNVYGPTETTANACIGELLDTGGDAPIGRPLGNLSAYVLDEDGRPVPIGYTGELHIGGIGVARGYHQRPELTAERFVANPFSEELGARMYKTGDCVRYLPDGRLQFLGRMDYQVKIRGYRVEPGEVESVLRRHATVRDAVVTARRSSQGLNQLVGYVTPSSEQAPNAQALRGFLDEVLPHYMVPSHFMVVDEFPLDGHGKVDRKALPEPSTADTETAGAYEPPRNAVETILAGLWAELLERERVGIHDRFLALGGHSLLATQLVVRVRDRLQVELPIGELFKADTVAALAEALAAFEVAPGRTAKIAEALIKIQSMSAEEVDEALRERRALVAAPP